MKASIWKVFVGTLVVLGTSFPAHALTIDPATTAALLTGNQTSQAQINAFIAGILGISEELYKQNVGGSEVGSLASSYETTFTNDPLDPSDALIHYVGGPSIGGNRFLLVKDGNHSPAWYLYNVSNLGWNGTDDLVLDNFWPAGGAISHVTLYGTAVPDGGSMAMLLGIGLMGLAGFRRFLS